MAPTTFSHGLLPIGRKGDPSASADSDPASGGNGNRRKTQQNLPNSEITRGPDTIDPVWLESLVNGGFNAAKAYFSSGEENIDTQGDLLKGIDNKTDFKVAPSLLSNTKFKRNCSQNCKVHIF